MADISGLNQDSDPYPSGNSADSSESLKNTETSFYHPNNTERSTDKAGLYKAEGGKKGGGLAPGGLATMAKVTPIGRAVAFASKHKKGAILGGGGLAGAIISLVLVFGFLVSHELLTIQQDLLRYEDKGISYIEKKAANQLLKRVMCSKINISSVASAKCTGIKANEAPDDPNNPLAHEVSSFDINNPEIVKGLSNQNISIDNGPKGEFQGFTDEITGQPIAATALSDPAMMARFSAAIPEWQTGQMETFRSLMIKNSGSTFDPIASPEDNNPTKEVSDDTLDTENNGPQLETANAEDTNQPSTNETPVQQAAAAADTTATGAIGDGLNVADQGIIAGESEVSTLTNATNAIKANLGKAALINTAIMLACSVYRTATKYSAARVPMIIGLLVRHSTTLLSLADEMKVGGAMTGSQISQITSLFNGNPAANPNSKNPIVAESALPFSRSAAWQRIEGNPVNTDPNSPGYNPGIATTALPTANTGTYVVNKISSMLGPVADICSVDHGIFGDIISGGLLVAQLFTDSFSFGTAQAVVFGITTSAASAVKYYVIPTLIKYFTPVGLDGLENAVQWMNNADAGTNLAFNMYSQRLGGKPLSNGQATTLASEGSGMQQVAQKQLSFYDRTFAFSNPASMVSKLIVDLPLSRIGMVESFLGDILRSPILLMHAFGSLIGGAKAYALSPTNPGQPYGITQYGFTNSEITRYDPLTNEQYLFHTTIIDNGQTRTLISLLGNPNNYPNATNDPHHNDVLHCFTQGYQVTAAESAPDPICGTTGNFDYAHLPPVPIDNYMVGYSFCNQLEPGWNHTFSPAYDPGCASRIAGMPQLNNIMARFRQYILDDEVMGYFTSLTNNQ